MNIDIAKPWMDALRWGNYQQGKNYLKEGDKYCCLGVLCDLYIKDKELTDKSVEDFRLLNEFKDPSDLPNEEVMDWIGMTKFQATKLAELNDEGSSFRTIADVISLLIGQDV